MTKIFVPRSRSNPLEDSGWLLLVPQEEKHSQANHQSLCLSYPMINCESNRSFHPWHEGRMKLYQHAFLLIQGCEECTLMQRSPQSCALLILFDRDDRRLKYILYSANVMSIDKQIFKWLHRKVTLKASYLDSGAKYLGVKKCQIYSSLCDLNIVAGHRKSDRSPTEKKLACSQSAGKRSQPVETACITVALVQLLSLNFFLRW